MKVFKPATKKQQGYFKALTGEWLPRNCSMQTASKLIDKAKRGEIEKKVITLRVLGQKLWSPNHRDHGVVKYVVARDYAPYFGPFDTLEEATARANADAALHGYTVEVSGSVRELYVD